MRKTPELLKEILRLNAKGKLRVIFEACGEEFEPVLEYKNIDDYILKDNFPVYYTRDSNQGNTTTKDLATLMACNISVEWKDERDHSEYIKEQLSRILEEVSTNIDYDKDKETLILELNYECNGNAVHFLRFKDSNLVINLKTLDAVEDHEVRDGISIYEDSDKMPFIVLNATTTIDSEFITVKRVSKENYYDFVDAVLNASNMMMSICFARQSIRCMDFNEPSVTTNAPEYCGNDVDAYFERQRDIDAGLYDEFKPTRIQKILKSMNSYVTDIRAALYHAMLNEDFILTHGYTLDKACSILHPDDINFKTFTSIMSKQVSNYIFYYTTLALAPQNLSMVKFESTPTEEDLESIDEMLFEVEEGLFIWKSGRSEDILDTYQDVKSFI